MAFTADTDIGSVSLTAIPAATVAPADNGAASMVSSGWDRARWYASFAFSQSISFLDQLRVLAGQLANIPSVDPNLGSVALNLTDFETMVGAQPYPPGNVFAYTEDPYTSDLLTQIKTLVTSWVSGTNTGLPLAVEQAIWERGRARELTNAATQTQQVLREFASRGFSKPPGAMALAIQKATQDAQNANSTFSREVATKQADLEQTNRRFAVEHAWKIEEGLITYTNLMAARALEKAKYIQQVLIDVFKAEVDGYQALVQAYVARVGAETAAFKAQVDLEVATANLRIEASKVNILRLIELLRLEIEAVKAGAQVSGQLAASALSGVNLSAGIQDSVSNAASMTSGATASVASSLAYAAGANYNYEIQT